MIIILRDGILSDGSGRKPRSFRFRLIRCLLFAVFELFFDFVFRVFRLGCHGDPDRNGRGLRTGVPSETPRMRQPPALPLRSNVGRYG